MTLLQQIFRAEQHIRQYPAFVALLQEPDPAGMRRATAPRLAGAPDRAQRYRYLAQAYVTHRRVENLAGWDGQP